MSRDLDYDVGWNDARTEIEAVIVNRMAQLAASPSPSHPHNSAPFHALAALRQELFDCPFTRLASLPPGRTQIEYALILEDDNHA